MTELVTPVIVLDVYPERLRPRLVNATRRDREERR